MNRCFSKCVTDVDKDQVEIILKGKITKAAGDGSLWTKAWDAEPLPATLSTDLALPKKDSNAPPVKFGLKSNRGALGSSSSGFGRNRFGGGGGKRGGGASPSPPRRRRRRNSSSSSDSSSRNRSNSRRNNDALSPDYGKNPNCIPLGSGGPKKSKFGNKQGAGPSPLRPGRGGAKNAKSRLGTAAAGGSKDVPYFYTDGRAKMTLDDDLASKELKQKRAARFTADTAGNRRSRKPAISLASLNNKLLSGGDFEEDFGGNWEDIHVVGTCQDLEKRYLRLTSAPEAHMVRPPNVLKKSLKMVVDHWKRKQDYHYACGQMKSIRQDLTVQGVRDTFTVQVYETHGRIALEKGDFTEFNQCQSQLKMLYHDIGGDNKLEFLSYRILYYMYTRETLGEIAISEIEYYNDFLQQKLVGKA